MYVFECYRRHVEARGQLAGVSSLLQCGSWAQNLRGQAWHQAPLPTEQSRTVRWYFNVSLDTEVCYLRLLGGFVYEVTYTNTLSGGLGPRAVSLLIMLRNASYSSLLILCSVASRENGIPNLMWDRGGCYKRKRHSSVQVGKTSDSTPAAEFHATQGTWDKYLQKTV